VSRLGLEPRTYGLTFRTECDAKQEIPCASDATDSRFAGDLLATLNRSPDLLRIVEAWPSLSEPIRKAILALVNAGKPTE
jgi:hypothetical protein